MIDATATRSPMRIKFADATPDDVAAIAAIQNAAAGALTARFGEGHWSTLVSERGTLAALRHARIRVGRVGRRIHTVLRLATKKPWAIDVSYFTPVRRPLYLTGMAVSVAHQGQGLGRLAMQDALAIARQWPADAVRLDAYDSPAGAGTFYARCGFQERGRAVYKGDPLIYYECLIDPKAEPLDGHRGGGRTRAATKRTGPKQRSADAAGRGGRRTRK